MSPVTPDTSARIAILRSKAADGTATLEDMKEAILLLRAGRVAAASASETSRRTKAQTAIPSADDLMARLMGGTP